MIGTRAELAAVKDPCSRFFVIARFAVNAFAE
jgi:hypothetical protein